MANNLNETPPALRLYGRKRILEDLVSALQGPTDATLIALRGKSGVGKSALLKQMAHDCRVHDDARVVVHHRIESQAYSVQDFLGMLTAQLLEQGAMPQRHFDSFRRSLNLLSKEHAIALATAGLIDLTSNLAPALKKTAESLVSVLSKTDSLSSHRASAEMIVRKGNDDILAAFIRLLNAMAQCGIKGTLLVDQVEYGSQSVIDAVVAIVRGLPSSWGLCLAMNDEIPEGQATMKMILPSLQYRGGTVRELPGLDMLALEVWTQDVRGQLPNSVELATVLANCGGRPLFLQDWVLGLTQTPEESLQNRLAGYYEQRLRALSGDARRLLRALAILPATTQFPFEFCHAILAQGAPNKPPDASLDVLTELQEKQFIDQAGSKDTYQLIHELTRHHVFRNTPQAVLRSTAETIFEIIRKAAPSSDARDQLNYLIVADLAQRNDIMRQESLPYARKFLAAGSYEAAQIAYQVCLRSLAASPLSKADDAVRANARMGLSTVLIHTGYYSESLVELERIDQSGLSVDDMTGVHLLRAEASLRLNRYREAELSVAAAKAGASSTRRIDLELEAERILNTILRDRGEYQAAIQQAQAFVKRAISVSAPKLVLCGCYRSLARSLAFQAPDEALTAAGAALAIAESEGSVRAEGNSYLAMAESYRHMRQLDEAASSYRKAIEKGELVANRDSVLWATLGLADVLTINRRFADALFVLDSISDVVRSGQTRHPLEHLHWKLSLATIDYLRTGDGSHELSSIVRAYKQMSISWPEQYVDGLVSGESTRPKQM